MELVQAGSSDILESQSSLILSRLLPILTEREGKLRNPAIKILQAIFRTSGQWLEPLYQVVSVHLCCALSHIEINIQFGALRFLDTLIESAPELVRRHSNQILPNCYLRFLSDLTTFNTWVITDPIIVNIFLRFHLFPYHLESLEV